MAKKKQTGADQCVWYTVVLATIIFVGVLAPPTPWRYAKMDAGMGNRFVMQRYYSLMGPTDAFGARQGWLTLSRKIERKVQEFCRPSPLTMLMGTASTMLGAGGAAMGCVSWEQCKTHVKARYYQYNTVGVVSICSMVGFLISALCAVGTIVCKGFEDGKEKKKKKKDAGACDFTPEQKTSIMSGMSAFVGLVSTMAFVVMTDTMFKDFKRTAHYPFAMAHAGAYGGGFAAFLMFVVFIYLTNRWYPCCKRKEKDEWVDPYGEGGAPAGGNYAAGEWGGQGSEWGGKGW